jgi:hypothetical protein
MIPMILINGTSKIYRLSGKPCIYVYRIRMLMIYSTELFAAALVYIPSRVANAAACHADPTWHISNPLPLANHAGHRVGTIRNTRGTQSDPILDWLVFSSRSITSPRIYH